MNETVIDIKNLGKKYKLGQRGASYATLRDGLTSLFTKRSESSRAQEVSKKEFWALDDINLKINHGEVVGIIGRNGAGKSTLLKILSRITEPSKGRVEIAGRVGSLLEVGTGFHPELTGRENIYLNGSIIGMRKYEIDKKLDEIIDFSEIEKFIDTPVKFYSSGMYVRLAFAVAAYLEPEILLVDEVLAVGDVKFQKKCLGKMDDVANRQGRTVIVVSHNMGIINSLCNRTILLNEGKMLFDGKTSEAVHRYTLLNSDKKVSIANRTDRSGNGAIKISELEILNTDGMKDIKTFDKLKIKIDFDKELSKFKDLRIMLGFYDIEERPLFRIESDSIDLSKLKNERSIIFYTEKINIVPLTCNVNVAVFIDGQMADYIPKVDSFDILSNLVDDIKFFTKDLATIVLKTDYIIE